MVGVWQELIIDGEQWVVSDTFARIRFFGKSRVEISQMVGEMSKL